MSNHNPASKSRSLFSANGGELQNSGGGYLFISARYTAYSQYIFTNNCGHSRCQTHMLQIVNMDGARVYATNRDSSSLGSCNLITIKRAMFQGYICDMCIQAVHEGLGGSRLNIKVISN